MLAQLQDKAATTLKNAVKLDDAKIYEQALTEYTAGIQLLMKVQSYVKNHESSTKLSNNIRSKIVEYLTRAEDR
eukprot:UN06267